jgi:hypothetical protein
MPIKFTPSLSSRVFAAARPTTTARTFLTSRPVLSKKLPDAGDQRKEHVTNTDNELDIQSQAAMSGQREKESDAKDNKTTAHSSATSGRDTNNVAGKTHSDMPEAPNTGGPKGSGKVMGMQDERGAVSCSLSLDYSWPARYTSFFVLCLLLANRSMAQSSLLAMYSACVYCDRSRNGAVSEYHKRRPS